MASVPQDLEVADREGAVGGSSAPREEDPAVKSTKATGLDRAHVAVLIAHSPNQEPEALQAFAAAALDRITPILQREGGMEWAFHQERPVRLPDHSPRQAAAFLQEASLRMVEGPYDAIVVVTDVALVSRKDRIVPGLASEAARVVVLSADRLRVSERGAPPRPLDSEAVLWNAATLVLHLVGHLLELRHVKGGGTAMSPFTFDPERRSVPPFAKDQRETLPERTAAFPEREDVDQGTLSELWFHLTSAARHPRQVVAQVLRSHAPLLSLRLPRLATAAVAPALILVFSAEIWDAGFHMTDGEIWTFAILSVLASAWYLLMAQRLFLPRKEKTFNTEHLAVVNVGITITIVVATVGLFAMLMVLMLGIQIFIFPPDLVREWPSLDLASADIALTDQIRIAALIATMGVLTGSLGGGLESRDVVRQLALFDAEP